MVEESRQAGEFIPHSWGDLRCDRGVGVPIGTDRNEIILLGKWIEKKFDGIGKYSAQHYTADILLLINAHREPMRETHDFGG
jgi:hypothetical protein